VAQGFNATPFGALPFTLVALPNISDVSALIVLSSILESKGAFANKSLLFSEFCKLAAGAAPKGSIGLTPALEAFEEPIFRLEVVVEDEEKLPKLDQLFVD